MTLTVLPAFSVTLYKKYCPSTTNSGDIVYQPTEIYFPIPPTATDIPTAPTIDTAPELIPPNSAVVDECFDPDNVDLSQIFNNLLPADETEAVYDSSITTDVLLQAKNQIYPIRAVLRSVFGVYKAGYSIAPRLTELPVLKLGLPPDIKTIVAMLNAEATSYVLGSPDVSILKSVSVACATASFVWSGVSADFSAQGSKTIFADGGSFTVNNEPEVILLSHFDSYDTYGFAEETGNTVGYNWYVNAKPAINTSVKKIGAGSLDFQSVDQSYLYTYLDPIKFDQFIPEFTIETWAYPKSDGNWVRAFGVGPESSDINTGYAIDVYSSDNPLFGEIEIVQRTGTGSEVTIFNSPGVELFPDQWHHVVLEQSAQGLRVYLNGVNIPNELITGEPLVWSLSGGTRGIDIRGSIQLGAYSPTPWGYIPNTTYGQIDELRIVAGAIYTGQSFTPPTVAYTTQSPLTIFTNLNKLVNISGLPATFTLTGQTAELTTPSLVIAAAPATFVLSGQDITTGQPSRVMLAETGTLTAAFIPSIGQPSVVNSVVGAATGVNVTLSWPSGYAADDLGIIFTETSSLDSNDRPITPPYGWAQVPNSIVTDNQSYSSAFYRFARTGSESAATIGWNGDHITYVMVVFRGVDTVNPFVEVASDVDTASNTSVTFPSLSELIPRTRIIESFTAGLDSGTTLTLSGRANVSDNWVDAGLINRRSTSSGNGGSMVVYNATTTKQTLGLPGSTGTLNTSRATTLMTIALRPKGWTEPPLVVDFAPVAGSYALVGQAADLRPSNITFAADAGSFSLTGQAIALLDGTTDTYIAAVESADGQDLETTVKVAINKFITGCKADGTWSAIKAACILAGARTLAGALVPLVGTAPTNNNFVSGDYSRTTGLVGDASTKYLDSNRTTSADPQNSKHAAVYATSIAVDNGTNVMNYVGAYEQTTPVVAFVIYTNATEPTGSLRTRSNNSTLTTTLGAHVPGLIGTNRSNSADYVVRGNQSNNTVTQSSVVPLGNTQLIYALNDATLPGVSAYSNARLSFYSIGESLDLALLDSRVTTLMSDIAAALP